MSILRILELLNTHHGHQCKDQRTHRYLITDKEWGKLSGGEEVERRLEGGDYERTKVFFLALARTRDPSP